MVIVQTAPSKLISAIVCTYNRYDVLADALSSLMDQSLDSASYEVLVIDNSTDLVAQRDFWRWGRSRFPVVLEVVPEPGLSKARNVGIRAAVAPIVAFCDDDAVVSRDWLRSLLGVFEEEPKAGAAGGPVVPIWPEAAPTWVHPWLRGYFTIVDHGVKRRALAETEWLAGTNVAFRREPLIETGGFSEALGRRGALLLSNEELDIMDRLRENGFQSFYEPAAVVHHKVHADRVDQAWLRRRVAWQVVSDGLSNNGQAGLDTAKAWGAIADYALGVPPQMRTIRGLFLDVEEPDVLRRQCEAISALMRLMMLDGHDPERRSE
jgi:GT2 family glycosyltransferase